MSAPPGKTPRTEVPAEAERQNEAYRLLRDGGDGPAQRGSSPLLHPRTAALLPPQTTPLQLAPSSLVASSTDDHHRPTTGAAASAETASVQSGQSLPVRQATPASSLMLPPVPDETPDAPTTEEIRGALDDLLNQGGDTDDGDVVVPPRASEESARSLASSQRRSTMAAPRASSDSSDAREQHMRVTTSSSTQEERRTDPAPLVGDAVADAKAPTTEPVSVQQDSLKTVATETSPVAVAPLSPSAAAVDNGPFESTTLDLLATSHAGDILYDVYKWKEQADREFEESGDLRLMPDVTIQIDAASMQDGASVAMANGITTTTTTTTTNGDVGGNESSDGATALGEASQYLSANANYPLGTRRNSDPGPAAAEALTGEPTEYEALQMPGGLRRHYVMQEHLEQTGEKEFQKAGRKLWTDSFVHFLTLYGQSMILQSSLDEDDHSDVGSCVSDDETDENEDDSSDGTSQQRRQKGNRHERSVHRAAAAGSPLSEADRMEQGLMTTAQEKEQLRKKHRRLQSYEQLVKDKKLSPKHHHHHHHHHNQGIQTSHPAVPLNSDSKAFFILLKSFVGAGILYVPHAFVRAGMATSFILIIAIALLSYYGMYLLIDTKTRLKGDHTFASIGRATFGSIQCRALGLSGHNFYLGETMRAIVEAALAVSQIGFAASSVIFIANNLDELIRFYFSKEVDIALLIFVQLVFYLPISLTRRIQKLSALAIIADVMILLGVLTVIYFDFKVLSTGTVASIKAFASSGAPQMVGTVVFSFEGIGLILPVQSSMQNPKQFPKLLAYVVTIIAGLLMLLSTLSYLAFGEQVQTIIWDSFPRDTLAHRNLIGIARIGYIIAILFTFPLLVLPATRILEGRISRWEIRKGQRASGKDKRRVKWTKNTIRWISCGVTCAIAYACGSQLANFVSLIGAVCCIPLLYILPAAFHAVLARSRLERVIDLLVMSIGIATMIYVTIVTMQNWGQGGGH